VLLLGLLLCGAGWARQVPASTSAVALTAALDRVSLMPHVRMLRDAEASLRESDLASHLTLPPGHPHGDIVSFGYSGAAYWFSVELDNRDAQVLQRLLVFEPTWLDNVRVTLTRPDGTQQTFQGGDTLPFNVRAVPHRNINFLLDLPPGVSRLLVRTQTRDPYVVGMTLWQRGAFFATDSRESVYVGVIYGAVGAMLLFNLFLFFSVREKIYAAYVAYVAAFVIGHLTYNGHLFPLLWPDSPVWGNWAHSVFIYAYSITGLYFSILFLELRQRQPRVHRWAQGLLALVLASCMLTALFGYGPHVISSIVWVIVYTPVILALGVLSLRRGNRAARFFLTASTAGFLGALVTASTVSGLLPYSFATFHAIDVGILIDTVLLSLALADRLRLARAETEQAKGRLLETERAYSRELEATVAQRTQELRQANATKDKFFAIVAHDLRSPIGSLAVLFNEAIATPKDLTADLLEIIRASTRSTCGFLEELLTWARVQRGEVDSHPVALDASEVLHEMQALFATQAKAKRVQLALDGQAPCWLMADPAMLRTVVRNLVNNALKFTPQGGVVRARLQAGAERCTLSVIDTGVGMDEDTVRNLFRLDAKHASTPGTRNETGTGLGLVLCKEFVGLMGGSLGVQSAKGQGSTFWFDLPAAGLGVVDSTVNEPPLAQADIQPLHLLVAEDQPLHREAAAQVLRGLGCRFDFAVDGAEAVRMALATPYDLILMDIDMPIVNGVEAARRLRAAGFGGCIVSLSSYSRQELHRQVQGLSFDGYLDKPLSRDALLRVLTACRQPVEVEPV
jgi:signal transduction histidine kinase/CheY-like chemotaxis protein